MVASLDWLRLMTEPKSGEERVDGLTFKIDEERADGWSAKTGEERADGWTYKKVVEQMLVDGDGSDSGGCHLAQVTPSTESQECAIRKWEELKTWVATVAPMVMASMASMVAWVASMASMVAWWRRWRRMVASNGGNWGLRHRGH